VKTTCRVSSNFQGCFKIQIRPPIIPVLIPAVDADADSFHLSLLINHLEAMPASYHQDPDVRADVSTVNLRTGTMGG
jgi:hypothetical protein